MTTATIPRFLLPQGIPHSAMRHLAGRASRPSVPLHRYATLKSSPSSSKPIVLEKPSKFRPPSHPARLNRAPPRQYPGPPLSAQEREVQKTKKYPHMFPPEGTFMHWFLTNRSIHLYITLGTLSILAVFTFVGNFHKTSPYADLLPPFRHFFSHPFNYIYQYFDVYRLHTAHISEQTSERRRRNVEDADKRKEYRKAHGLEKDKDGIWPFSGWTGKKQGEQLGPAISVPGRVDPRAGQEVIAEPREGYTDWEGKKKPVKKWLGIW